MTITQDNRHDMHSVLIEKLGRESATTLMELLPPVGWADVARRSDVESARLATSQDFLLMTASTSAQFNLVWTEFAAVRSEMSAEFAAVRSEMSLGFAEIRVEMYKAFHRNTLMLIGAMTAINAIIVGVAGVLLKTL
ncbi:hypothetical protein LBMAG13_19080 [Actinomycetes bacterium]|nr:hypothetical protein LBMAG13_19080 [Actinomycetes bacterium]